MYLNFYSLLLLISALHFGSTINILGIFDFPSKSIHILGYKLLSGLVNRGYNVTLMSPFLMEEKIENFTHVYIEGTFEYKDKGGRNVMQGVSSMASLKVFNLQTYLVNFAMQSKMMQNFLKSNNTYDVIIQLYAFNEAYLALAHHFDARVIGYIPYTGYPHINDLTGNSAPYSYVSVPFLAHTQDMTFLQRTMNTIIGTFMTLLHKFYLFPRQEALLRKYAPHAPPLDKIQRDRVDLVFVNAHFSHTLPRPNTPNVIDIGGYHVQNPEQLSPELKKYMDNAKEGIIFCGFGSNVDPSKFPKETLDVFLNKFRKVPYKVLFKYNGVLEDKPKNVETSPWYPQEAILAHPNIKAFISHGGVSSFIESMCYGIPVLCISVFGDQKKNCAEIASYGYGIHLPIQEVTQETFVTAFNQLIQNPQYREKAKLRSALFKEHEINPFDRASFWIDHVHKFKGAKHLQPKSATMPLYQYLLLDVWGFIFIVTVTTTFIFYHITKLVLKSLYKRYNKTKVTEKVKGS